MGRTRTRTRSSTWKRSSYAASAARGGQQCSSTFITLCDGCVGSAHLRVWPRNICTPMMPARRDRPRVSGLAILAHQTPASTHSQSHSMQN